mgnify:CR=1 FL=1
MKTTFAILFFLVSLITVSAQKTNPNYDEALANKLGADEYGMKKYVLVILKTGENTTATSEETSSAFRGHMENINRLAVEGKLIVAGPMGKNEKNYRGIFILDVPTVEEAGKLVQTDPAVRAKLLDVELFPWYGSAALADYLHASDKIWKVRP